MRREPFSSLDELLAPETLSRLVRQPITTARRLPFVGGHSASGSEFLAIETNGGHGPRFVVKLSSPESDWIVRVTADSHGREVLVWTSGLLDRLPPEISHPVIACAHDGGRWAILMHDVSDDLLADPIGETPIAEDDHFRYLDAMAALHAAFWERPEITDPALGYCHPRHLYAAFTPATVAREADHPNDVIRWIREGWDAYWPLIEPDVAALLRGLLEDPLQLCAALNRYPQTVLHGDLRGANLGLEPRPPRRVILLDWHLVGPGTPAVDLAWYIGSIESRVAVCNQETIARYRDRLAFRLGHRFSESWWRPQLALSLLGQVVRKGWILGFRAVHHPSAEVRDWTRQHMGWWSEQAKEGARWL